MPRLIIVSNRLPVTITVEGGSATLEHSVGGLATGLAPFHQGSDGLWIGWPGDVTQVGEAELRRLEACLREQRTIPVHLSPDEVARYYEGYSNGVVWPLFHYFPGVMPPEISDWDVYEAVNQRFADVIAEHWTEGDLVWVHDYQLMRVPALLRERIPQARIGFFLHIPFPSSEVFSLLPQRSAILAGLLGADLVGFHTASYMRHFASSILRVHGVASEFDRIEWGERMVQLGVFPMGVDARSFSATARDPAVLEIAQTYRAPDGPRILLGIDRLDYTKGIPQRLLAFHRLLERHPELHGEVRLVQIGVPSRENVDAYRTFRKEIDELVGRINGTFGTPQWTPVHWIARGLPREELVALYSAAAAMLVTPLRDGMNLVAKEFAAANASEEGVLVLSEFAGAASELAEALLVNPFDIDGMADTLYRALTMPEHERRARMRRLRSRVFERDVDRWARDFIDAAWRASDDLSRQGAGIPPQAPPGLAAEIAAASHLVLLLDYDGTLVPFAPTPELAAPTRDVLDLLAALAGRPRTTVHVVSGRSWSSLEAWLGHLPVGLHAEHGVWSRSPDGTRRSIAAIERGAWYDQVLQVLEDFTRSTPGSLIEEKTLGLAWHYRGVEPDFGRRQARELQAHLASLLSNAPAEVLTGDKVIEVRPFAIDKGAVARAVISEAPAGATVVAFGDDRTDEDLFAALPDEAISIHVGRGASRARYRLRGVHEVRRLLRALLDDAPVTSRVA